MTQGQDADRNGAMQLIISGVDDGKGTNSYEDSWS